MVIARLALTSFLLFTCSLSCYAGSRQSGNAILPVEDLARLSKKVEQYAAEKGARVFFMARQGRPDKDLPSGVVYTHVSYAVYSNIQTEDGREIPGYAIYNLYQKEDNPALSHLVVDFPLDFLAGAQKARVGVIIPSARLQKRLLEVIQSDTYSRLHNPSYSAIANPYNDRYQNCTEHVLDVLNAAIYQTDDVSQIKANTRAYFEAQTLKINPFKLMLGSLFKSEVKTADHKGKIQTATFTTLARYLESNRLVEEVRHIEL